MNLIVANIKWIMLLSGALTCTMIYAAIEPLAALRSSFGETLEGPLAEIRVAHSNLVGPAPMRYVGSEWRLH